MSTENKPELPREVDSRVISRAQSGAAPVLGEAGDWLPPIRLAEDLLADKTLKMPKAVVKGVIHRGSRGVLAGPPKSGKSYVLLDLGASVATGSPWLNTWKTAKGRVLYADLEIMEAALAARVRRIKEAKVEAFGLLDFGNLEVVSLQAQVELGIPRATFFREKKKLVDAELVRQHEKSKRWCKPA